MIGHAIRMVFGAGLVTGIVGTSLVEFSPARAVLLYAALGLVWLSGFFRGRA